jgi:hypothetical protein
MPGTLTTSNALSFFGAVVDAHCRHAPTIVGRAEPHERKRMDAVLE